MNLRESMDEAAAEKQREKFEEARQAMQEDRLKQDHAALLRKIGFYHAMKEIK